LDFSSCLLEELVDRDVKLSGLFDKGITQKED
jgi:hypothetical protein